MVTWHLLAGAAVANTAPRNPDARARSTKEQLDKAPKHKIGDEVMVVGMWRNCRFHMVTVKAERKVATLPDGESAEIVSVLPLAKDDVDAQLPERDPKCESVEPSAEQIAANHAAIDAETARLNGRQVVPGGPAGDHR